MDYGQPVNTDYSPEQGSEIFNAENDLNLNNWDVSPERDNRNIGNIAINSPELPKDLEEQVLPGGETLPEMGEVVQIDAAPNDASSKNSSKIVKFDVKRIKTGEMLGAEGVDMVNESINKLGQDKNVADFYDNVRAMMEANLINSYGENAAFKGEKAA